MQALWNTILAYAKAHTWVYPLLFIFGVWLLSRLGRVLIARYMTQRTKQLEAKQAESPLTEEEKQSQQEEESFLPIILRRLLDFVLFIVAAAVLHFVININFIPLAVSAKKLDVPYAIVFVCIFAFLFSRTVKVFLKRYGQKLEGNNDKTLFSFLLHTVDFIIIIVAAISIAYTIPTLRPIAVGAFTSAGVLAALIGFASQKAFSNIASGVFIVIFKPFRVGDFIVVGTHWGQVEDITLRHTVIVGLENRRIVIPNSTISTEAIKNSSIRDPKTCRFIELNFMPHTDVDKVREIMQEEALKHPECIDNRSVTDVTEGVPVVRVRMVDINDQGLRIRAYVWAATPVSAFTMGCDLMEIYKKRFAEEGIQLAFGVRTLQQGGLGD